MPGRAIAFDLTRLITRLRHASPSGIDRVDLAYARHYLGQKGLRFGLVSTAFGPRVVEREAALGIVDSVEAGWDEELEAEDDPVYRRLCLSLGADDLPAAVHGPLPDNDRSARLRRRRLQFDTSLRVLRSAGPERLPPDTIYLHGSHLRLDRPARFDWLYDRPDIRAVFFIHDLIPISHPEYGRPGESARHASRIATVARHAAHILVNSAEVGRRLTEYLDARRLGRRPITVAPLAVEPVFCRRAGSAPVFAKPVFVVCGTIESRKNHLLLLNLWRALAEARGPDTPQLVIVGRRGWEAESVFDMLERCPALDGPVHEVAGLSTKGLAELMRGATALLMPSFIEGYGLPVVEAAASGLPVVASDIPSHREIAEGCAHLLDPLDGSGWRDAVVALGAPDSPLRGALIDKLARYQPPTWSAHFARVDAVLEGFGAI